MGALLVLALLIPLSDGPEAFKGGWHWESAGIAVCEGAISVSVSLLVLDWARRHVVAHGRFERSLAGSAYGAFVARGPVLVIGALLLGALDMSGDLEFAVLTVVGVVGSFSCRWRPSRSALHSPDEATDRPSAPLATD